MAESILFRRLRQVNGQSRLGILRQVDATVSGARLDDLGVSPLAVSWGAIISDLMADARRGAEPSARPMERRGAPRPYSVSAVPRLLTAPYPKSRKLLPRRRRLRHYARGTETGA